MALIARWQSGGGAGKYWAELHHENGAFTYRGGEGNETLENSKVTSTGVLAANHEDDALYSMRNRTKAGAGIFHPDDAKTDMSETLFHDRRSNG